MTRSMKYLAHVLFVLIVLASTAWSATALWLHLTGGLRVGALGALIAMALTALILRFKRGRRLGWATLALGGLAVAGWYQTITPEQTRDWAMDVSKGVRAEVEGDHVRLANIRDFEWQSKTEATPRWITEDYDLNDLETVDMITSVWDNPDIAHLLVSFGFASGENVVFSVEIRREANEEFNELGGFFRQFELVLIAATERDIVKLRTNYRKEQVRLYPVHLSAEQRRTMFLSYVELAQRLEEKPSFYNTITANCTTSVWALALALKPDLPMDERLILSGRLPDYLTDLGVIDAAPAEERDENALITPLAQNDTGEASFSDVIRRK
ncbi:DUF4105 domain-containing protein [Celeribacter sp.]|uniref:Lnb N-terminal periplasmic domain-containing protein n=1 Tax=Celeribacter sp. TaxID=1890673 RepID=UPI003A923F5C